jgi:large subunit ribosomal protein L2
MSFYQSTFSRAGGRNNRGRITVRHRGTPRRRRYTSRFPFFLPPFRAVRYRVQPRPTRQLIVIAKPAPGKYSLGFFPFRLREFPYSITFGSLSAPVATARLHTIPPGTFVTFVQAAHTGRPVFGRAPGSRVQVLRRRGSYTTIRLPSGELRRIHAKLFSFATTIEPATFTTPVYYKAGQIRQLGLRPHVRGCAMNPVDHPHGGRTGESRPSVTPWGILTKGHRTRTAPVNAKIILRTVQQFKRSRRLCVIF